jgi:hypothetical protein
MHFGQDRNYADTANRQQHPHGPGLGQRSQALTTKQFARAIRAQVEPKDGGDRQSNDQRRSGRGGAFDQPEQASGQANLN